MSAPRAGAGPWQVETIFVDSDRGHGLSSAELDGRNGTDELVCTGYSGRVVVLARPPGFGTPEIGPLQIGPLQIGIDSASTR